MSRKPKAPKTSKTPKAAKAAKTPGGPAWLPGDPALAAIPEEVIRVDHAGEYGAVRIYAGQLAVLPPGPARDAVTEMAAQEARHLEAFTELLGERSVRPTALMPVWHLAGWMMGAATALLGERAAMACTVAVEEVIDEHYAGQAERLGTDEAALKTLVETFRAEELAHRATALAHEAEAAVGYPILSAAVKAASRTAIALSTRL